MHIITESIYECCKTENRIARFLIILLDIMVYEKKENN